MIFFFFNDTATTEIYTLSLHDALPIYGETAGVLRPEHEPADLGKPVPVLSEPRSEEHTSELQSRLHLVCRLLLEKKKITFDHNCWWSHTERQLLCLSYNHSLIVTI